MDASFHSRERTRILARILGPFLILVPGIIALRAGSLNSMMAGFFETPVIVWILGGQLLLMGLLIIAFHQYWSSPEAVLISLFGWFLGIRGAILMAMPDMMQSGVEFSLDYLWPIRIGFSFLVLCGAWLFYIGWIRKV